MFSCRERLGLAREQAAYRISVLARLQPSDLRLLSLSLPCPSKLRTYHGARHEQASQGEHTTTRVPLSIEIVLVFFKPLKHPLSVEFNLLKVVSHFHLGLTEWRKARSAAVASNFNLGVED